MHKISNTTNQQIHLSVSIPHHFLELSKQPPTQRIPIHPVKQIPIHTTHVCSPYVTVTIDTQEEKLVKTGSSVSPITQSLKATMDHLALSSSLTKTAPFVSGTGRRRRDRVRVPAALISCRGGAGAGLGSKRGKGRTTDFYEVLSISNSKDVACDEIKRAYRNMALRYHPDVCHDPEMKEEVTRMFVQVNEAYRTLSDPVLRSEYDFELGLSGLGRDEFQASSSITCNDRSDLERQFERAVWQDQGSEMRNVRDEASELRRRNTCRMGKKGQNRMRR